MAKVLMLTLFFTALMSSRGQSCYVQSPFYVRVPLTIPAGYVTKVETSGCDPTSLWFSSKDPSFTVRSDGVIIALRSVTMETGERTFSVGVHDNNGPESEMEVHLVYKRTRKTNEKREAVLRRTKRHWRPAPFHILENGKPPFPIYIDQFVSDSSQNYSVFYTLRGPGIDEYPFDIFSFNSENGKLYLKQSVDREEYSEFHLTARVFDKVNQKERDNPAPITVIVDDENDNAPEFIGPLQFVVDEQNGPGTLVGQLKSTDRDDPNTDHSRVQYKLLSGLNYFAIHPKSGTITTVTNTLDRETTDKHFVIVEARDREGAANGLFTTCTVTINLRDVNDNPPTFLKTPYKATIAENVGEKLLLRIPVEDKDLINTPNWISKFIITKGNENGNFRIDRDPATNEGCLYVTKPLDYEVSPIVRLEVLARNEAELNSTSAQWQTVPVNVTVTDVDEGPEFSAPTITFTIKENTPNGTLIGTYSAKDPETKKSDGITYYKSSDPGGWVNVDKNTGQLTVANTIDRESDLVRDGMYNITVRAVDATSKSGTGTVILKIIDENDNMPVIPPGLVLCQKTEDELGSVVVTAEDKDGSPNTFPFSFRLPPDNDGTWSLEPLNATSAKLKQVKPLSTGIYDVPITVRDQQGYGAEKITKVTICRCRSGVCLAQKRAVALGPMGALALFLPLLLLLLLCLFLIFICATKKQKAQIMEADDYKGTLLESNTEALGDNVDANFLSMGLDQAAKGSKVSIMNQGWAGNKSFSTIGGHSMHDFGYNQSGMTMTNIQDVYSRQFDHYGTQHVGSTLLGNGMDYRSQDSSLLHWQTVELMLQERMKYMGQKEREEEEVNDTLHCYGYEGAGSTAGSVGCHSDIGDRDNLEFLNALGPKFKSLAEVCTKS
uniref:Desmocollin 2 like n=2 Tax=Nothobranchius rachovii TaxID=451742 RepID=A0A1A8PC63_9TELE